MEKHDMRVFLGDLEDRIDKRLKKWKKFSHVEDKEIAQIEWQFETARIVLDVFWTQNKERIKLECACSRAHTLNEWDGLTSQTANNVMDRIGNFAQTVAAKRDE